MSPQIQTPAKALPDPLPEGESVLWQGQPAWRGMAKRVFHIRAIAFYFAVLLLWKIGSALAAGSSPAATMSAVLWFLPVAAAAIAIPAVLALIYAGTTTYVVTERRVIMRFGAALPITVNIPYSIVGNAGARVFSDGTADIPIKLVGSGRLAYMHLWPHARPWHLRHPEPMLRAVPDGARVAALLANALIAATGDTPPRGAMAMPRPAAHNETQADDVLSPAAA